MKKPTKRTTQMNEQLSENQNASEQSSDVKPIVSRSLAAQPKIFLWCVPCGRFSPGDVIGYALAEDGEGLASHLSSNESFSRHDMGFTSDWKHENYKKKYPDGYDLVWVVDPDTHQDFQKAFELNKQLAANDG